jgi:hypothetical protein
LYQFSNSESLQVFPKANSSCRGPYIYGAALENLVSRATNRASKWIDCAQFVLGGLGLKVSTLLFALTCLVFPFQLESAFAQSGIVVHHTPALQKTNLTAETATPVSESRVYWFDINNSGYGSAPSSMILPTANGACGWGALVFASVAGG